MSSMDDLIAFLRARLDEDRAAALAASWDEWDGSHWTAHHREQYDGQWAIIDRADEGVVTTIDPQAAQDAPVAQHIARHDPARALRHVEALRGVLEEWDTATGVAAETFAFGRGTARMTLSALEPIMRHLVIEYADHSDYRDDWKPRSSWS